MASLGRAYNDIAWDIFLHPHFYKVVNIANCQERLALETQLQVLSCTYNF